MPTSDHEQGSQLKEIVADMEKELDFKTFLMSISNVVTYISSVPDFKKPIESKRVQLKKAEVILDFLNKKVDQEVIILRKKKGLWRIPQQPAPSRVATLLKIRELRPLCDSYPSFIAAKDKFDELQKKSVWVAWKKLLSIKKYQDGQVEKIRPGYLSDLVDIKKAEESLLPKKQILELRTHYLRLVSIVANYCLTEARSKKTHGDQDSFACLEYIKETREISVDGTSIAHPDFTSLNHDVFEYLYDNPGVTFTKSELEVALKIPIKKSLLAFLDNLNFHGTMRRLFFSATGTSIRLNGTKIPVTTKDRILLRKEIASIKAKNRASSAKKINKHK